MINDPNTLDPTTGTPSQLPVPVSTPDPVVTPPVADPIPVVSPVPAPVLPVEADINTLLQAVYAHTPSVENTIISSIITFFHQRIVALETIIDKLKSGGIV